MQLGGRYAIMSKLIELIRKLGQQSQQPLGFGALANRAKASPTMALIGTAAAVNLADSMDAIESKVVDAVVLDSDNVNSIKDCAGIENLVWGVGPGALSNEDVETLASSGCDFFVINPATAPAAIVSQTDTATIVTLSEPADRETSLAMRELGVRGSLSRLPTDSEGIAYRDLVAVRRMGASVGGALIVEAPNKVSTADLTALRDAGVDGILVPLSESEWVSDIAKKIRELPPRKRSSASEETRFQALAPSGSD